MKFKQYSDNEKKQMALDYEAGESLKELSGRFGVSIPTMAKYVRAGGGNVRKPGTVRHGNGDFAKVVESVNRAIDAVNVATGTKDTLFELEKMAVPTRVLLPVD